MKIKIHEIPDEGLSVMVGEYPFRRDPERLIVEGPLDGKLLIKKRSEQLVYIRGTLSASLRLSCRRCLNSFLYPIQSDFSLDCAPAVRTRSGQERQLYREEMDFYFYHEDMLDTDEIIENQLYLESPMAPLCKDDCKGLCSLCGEDLNTDTHVCVQSTIKGKNG